MTVAGSPAALIAAALALALGALCWQWWRAYRSPQPLDRLPRAPFWTSVTAWVLLGLLLAPAREAEWPARAAAWALPALGLFATALIRLIRAEVPGLVAEERLGGGRRAGARGEPGELDPEDRRLVQRMLSLRRRQAVELMLPLPRAATLRAGATLAEAVEALRARSQWRLPILDAEGRRALGVIESRDLARQALAAAQGLLAPDEAGEDVRRRCQPIPEVGAAQPAADLVVALRGDSHGLVAVVDRQGRVLGFASWDHVFQALVGRRGEEVAL
ncbi:MAG: CBS domain-containing protein [Candidatus Eisenbacteria bacterium]|uniref:CBS domain-containing protein n=1 Tax=Eiseniibacteriota bacterium TaxID=2212470 RepID=A0A938BMI2_UNCEI|nr:CBS domain-containing protein [Candidatus Eisenbacteria bacterium]